MPRIGKRALHRGALNKRNQFGLEIYEELLALAERESENVEDEDNLIKIFMHQLMIFLSGHYMHKTGEFDDFQVSVDASFPFVSSRFFESPERFASRREKGSKRSKIPLPLLNFATTIAFFLINRRFRGPRLELSLTSKYCVSTLRLWAEAMNVGVKPRWFKSMPSAIQNLEGQVQNIAEFLEAWCDRHNIENGNLRAKIFCSEILKFVRPAEPLSRARNRVRQTTCMVLTGSQTAIEERLNAVNAIKRGKYVFLLSHGLHSSHAIDEPVVGYAERSYCHAEIGYGRNFSVTQSYNSSLTPPCDFLARSAKTIMSARNSACSGNIHLAASVGTDPKILYVPTSLAGSYNYLPFRNIPEKLYLAWQRSLAQEIPGMAIKPHPKQTVAAASNFSKIETGKLSDVIQHYDLLVFDYVSSAFAEAAASDRAIMYLETGGRNLSKQALAAIQDRCHYVDVRDGSTQIIDEIKSSNFEGKNRFAYTDLFSMAAADLATAEPTSEEAGVIREIVNFIKQRRVDEF